MKVEDLNGRQYSWPPTGHEVSLSDKRPRSEPHLRCRALLRAMYPTQPILEEVPLPGIGLFCDFYLPFRQVMIECHGEQHYTYTAHFHGSRQGFAKSKRRDQNKIDWCCINNIDMAILPHSETEDEWRTRIEDADD